MSCLHRNNWTTNFSLSILSILSFKLVDMAFGGFVILISILTLLRKAWTHNCDVFTLAHQALDKRFTVLCKVIWLETQETYLFVSDYLPFLFHGHVRCSETSCTFRVLLAKNTDFLVRNNQSSSSWNIFHQTNIPIQRSRRRVLNFIDPSFSFPNNRCWYF